MSTTRFQLNGRAVELHTDEHLPLLWALRDHLGLRGTKPGCLQGVCGACTVHLDGAALRACQLPLAAVAGRSVTTIEGLPESLRARLQASWAEHQALQCGYCQPGQVMSAAALLLRSPAPSAADARATMAGHLCRCGSGPRVADAVLAAMVTPPGSAT